MFITLTTILCIQHNIQTARYHKATQVIKRNKERAEVSTYQLVTEALSRQPPKLGHITKLRKSVTFKFKRDMIASKSISSQSW